MSANNFHTRMAFHKCRILFIFIQTLLFCKPSLTKLMKWRPDEKSSYLLSLSDDCKLGKREQDGDSYDECDEVASPSPVSLGPLRERRGAREFSAIRFSK